jgi:hypothetical protein
MPGVNKGTVHFLNLEKIAERIVVLGRLEMSIIDNYSDDIIEEMMEKTPAIIITKNQEISEIYTLLVNTTTDILYRFLEYLTQNRENPPKIIDVSILEEINQIVDYANECLADVAHTYACARHVVDQQLRVLRGQRATEYIAERRAILESAASAS